MGKVHQSRSRSGETNDFAILTSGAKLRAGLLALALAAAIIAPSGAQAAPRKPFASSELLVTFKSNPLSESAAQSNRRVGARTVRTFSFLKTQKVQLPKGMSIAEALSRYSKDSNIAAAQPNYYYHSRGAAPTVTLPQRPPATEPNNPNPDPNNPKRNPNDRLFKDQYGLRKIKAPEAWVTTTGSRNIVVAVIDSGVNYSHVDLNANMWRNPGETPGNGVDDDANGYIDDYFGIDPVNGDTNPSDDDGHGTHGAGTIGAVGNNREGIAGVNWNVSIMALKALDEDGVGRTSDIVACFEYMIRMKNKGVNIRVANHSYGGELPSGTASDPLITAAFDDAGEANILNVVQPETTARQLFKPRIFPQITPRPASFQLALQMKESPRVLN
jgi:subtilisin family serine protease